MYRRPICFAGCVCGVLSFFKSWAVDSSKPRRRYESGCFFAVSVERRRGRIGKRMEVVAICFFFLYSFQIVV